MSALYIYTQRDTTLPFKCLYTTEYRTVVRNVPAVFHLTQDLRIYSVNSGWLLLNGTARIGNQTWSLRRSVFMGKGTQNQNETFRFRLDRVSKIAGDDTPDEIVDSLLNEYRIDDNLVQFDIFPLQDSTYLIGGPYAFISLCIRY